jgi:aspartate racemase
MGPLASAEFVKTVYEQGLHGPEQQAPAVMLLSNPGLPDRTEALLNGRSEALLQALIRTLRRLEEMGASEIVICCVTIHHLLPQLPKPLRRRVRSLVTEILTEVAVRGERQLLLCSSGARLLGVYQQHSLWGYVEPLVVWPTERDQHEVHRLIYRIKENQTAGAVDAVTAWARAYGVTSFIAGCTELHLVAKQLDSNAGITCLDPLLMTATAWARLTPSTV